MKGLISVFIIGITSVFVGVIIGKSSNYEGKVDGSTTTERDGIPTRRAQAVPKTSRTGDCRSTVLETVQKSYY